MPPLAITAQSTSFSRRPGFGALGYIFKQFMENILVNNQEIIKEGVLDGY
jgi:hypothetical protein